MTRFVGSLPGKANNHVTVIAPTSLLTDLACGRSLSIVGYGRTAYFDHLVPFVPFQGTSVVEFRSLIHLRRFVYVRYVLGFPPSVPYVPRPFAVYYDVDLFLALRRMQLLLVPCVQKELQSKPSTECWFANGMCEENSVVQFCKLIEAGHVPLLHFRAMAYSILNDEVGSCHFLSTIADVLHNRFRTDKYRQWQVMSITFDSLRTMLHAIGCESLNVCVKARTRLVISRSCNIR